MVSKDRLNRNGENERFLFFKGSFYVKRRTNERFLHQKIELKLMATNERFLTPKNLFKRYEQKLNVIRHFIYILGETRKTKQDF